MTRYAVQSVHPPTGREPPFLKRTSTRRGFTTRGDTRTVMLETHVANAPTVERWKSFGWRVIDGGAA